MQLLIPGPLLPYTKKRYVEASGASIATTARYGSRAYVAPPCNRR